MAHSSGMQKTLKAPIHCRGIGLHSGAHIEMVLRPAAPDSGIRFYRSDLNTEIAADWRNAVDSPLCTTLTNSKGVSVGTVEHLMAALAGLEIDNVVVGRRDPGAADSTIIPPVLRHDPWRRVHTEQTPIVGTGTRVWSEILEHFPEGSGTCPCQVERPESC